jgi:uncharacterized protein YjbI with pentapeptide repeats
MVRHALLVIALLCIGSRAFAVQVDFVDVNGGMACIIKSGQHEILVEGGGEPMVLKRYVEKQKLIDGNVELAIVLHPSSVAYAGFRRLLHDGVTIEQYWDAGWDDASGRDAPTRSYRQLLQALQDRGTDVIRPFGAAHAPAAFTGRMEWFSMPSIPEARFCLLYARTFRNSERNQWPTLALLIEIEHVRILFSGHTGSERQPADGSAATDVEARLVDLARRIPGALHADVMVAPWMGSPRSSSREFIAAVDPKIAVISGAPRYRLPAVETIERYQKLGRTVMVTTLHPESLRDNVTCAREFFDDEITCSYTSILGAGERAEWEGTAGGNPVNAEFVVGALAPDRSGSDRKEARPSVAGADLAGIDLSKVIAPGVDLNHASLRFANLTGIDLTGANLAGADLSFARLDGATLRNVITDAATNFHGIQAPRADFSGTHLAGCDLTAALIPNADLSGVDATGANFTGADLRQAKLSSATLKDARIFGAAFDDALWELRPGGTPAAEEMAGAPYLRTLRTERSPGALIEVRDGFRKAGLHDDARFMTWLIQRRDRKRLEENGQWLESKAKWLLFELPTEWGMSAMRPLRIVAVLWLLFAVVYFLFVRVGSASAIRMVVTRRRRDDPTKNRMHVRLIRTVVPRRQSRTGRAAARIRFELRTMLTALNFSFRNMLNLKFQWLDAAAWIRLLQRRDFELEGVGWVRTVAGMQSLVSLYLIAMSILTYFSNPFD